MVDSNSTNHEKRSYCGSTIQPTPHFFCQSYLGKLCSRYTYLILRTGIWDQRILWWSICVHWSFVLLPLSLDNTGWQPDHGLHLCGCSDFYWTQHAAWRKSRGIIFTKCLPFLFIGGTCSAMITFWKEIENYELPYLTFFNPYPLDIYLYYLSVYS